jgi:hypothetical protein
MKEKSKVLGLVLVCMGLVFLGGCATTNIADTASGHIIINAPVAEVFEHISAEDADWDTNVKDLRDVDGHGLGATAGFTYEIAGQKYDGESVTTVYVPNEKLVTMSSGEVDSTWTWLFVERGDSTKLVLVIEYSMEMPQSVSVAKDVFARQLDDNVDDALEDIKKQIEKK